MDNAIMLTVPGAMEAGLADLLFWGALAVALVVAGMFAFPVNRWLISRGMGHAVVHQSGHAAFPTRLVTAVAVVMAVFGSAVLIAETVDSSADSADEGSHMALACLPSSPPQAARPNAAVMTARPSASQRNGLCTVRIFIPTPCRASVRPRSAQRRDAGDVAPNAVDPTLEGAVDAMGDHQHGGASGHLLPTRKNVRLVSKLSPTDRFGDIVDGQIADLAVFKGFAYLDSWSEETCTRGGTYVVDIKRPDRPVQAGFIPALPGNYHGEGAQVVQLKTNKFKGDLLAVNNERCADVEAGGGFDLYDVSNPRKPKTLVQGFGDSGPDDGSLVGDEPVHDAHSVFVWQDGRTAGRPTCSSSTTWSSTTSTSST